MKPIGPVFADGRELPSNARELNIAEKQPQYEPLPAVVLDSPQGEVITRWELTDDEIKKITETRSVYLIVSTFGHKLQPVILTADAPEFSYDELPIELRDMPGSGYIKEVDELIRALNQAGRNTTGYGFCLGCNGYHSHEFGTKMNCRNTAPAGDPAFAHLN